MTCIQLQLQGQPPALLQAHRFNYQALFCGRLSSRCPAQARRQRGDGATKSSNHAQTSPRVACGVTAAAAAAVPFDGRGDDGTTPPAPEGVQQYQRELFGRMISFLGPATLIPLGDPLMSLVDTVCIGQFAGTSQLAALGPANLVFSFAQYMFQSLQVATLSLLAGFLRDGRLRRSEETLSTAVLMAAVLGLFSMAVLESAPAAIIRATGVSDPALLPLASEYLRLRGLAQPAVLVTMVAQSGLLAQQDSATPALTVGASVLVSLIGSVVFVAGLGWGLAGAAITTVACQYVGAAALLYALSVRGKLRMRLSAPRREVVWQLLRTMGPLSITYLCKNVSYLFIQTTAASLATAKLAAHQALFAVWNLLAWTVTPFEQAALTYLPGSRGWRKTAGIKLLVGLGAAGGVACGCALAALVCVAPQAMTRDAAVWPHMRSVAALGSASMLALGADVVASGVNIGLGDARYVAKSYIITLLALGGFMAASRAAGWELAGVWWGVVVFFGVRALQSMGRVFWRHFRPGAAAEEAAREAAEAEAEAAARASGPTLASTESSGAEAFSSVEAAQTVETVGTMDSALEELAEVRAEVQTLPGSSGGGGSVQQGGAPRPAATDAAAAAAACSGATGVHGNGSVVKSNGADAGNGNGSSNGNGRPEVVAVAGRQVGSAPGGDDVAGAG